MGHGVRADGNDRGIERTQFVPPGEVERFAVQFRRNEGRSGVLQHCLHPSSAPEVELLHPMDERFDLRRGTDFASELFPQRRCGELQAPASLVAPQPAPLLDEARTDEEGGWNTERSQDRISDPHIAAHAVVEHDRCPPPPARDARCAERCGEFSQRYEREYAPQVAQLPLEQRGAATRGTVAQKNDVVAPLERARLPHTQPIRNGPWRAHQFPYQHTKHTYVLAVTGSCHGPLVLTDGHISHADHSPLRRVRYDVRYKRQCRFRRRTFERS